MGAILTKNDYKFFNKARDVANLSDMKRVHIGCVAVYRGNIIGVGCNTNKTHPAQQHYNKYRLEDYNITARLHAEIHCLNSIRNLDIQFQKVKLYIYRIRIDQPYGMSRPCPSCMAAIKDLGISQIYYTTNNGFAYEKLYINGERGCA